MTAEGIKASNLRRIYPRIAAAYDLYCECKAESILHMKIEKSSGKKNNVEHKIIPYTTGYSSLPEPGGLLDQDNWTMAMFMAFRSGERKALGKAIK